MENKKIITPAQTFVVELLVEGGARYQVETDGESFEAVFEEGNRCLEHDGRFVWPESKDGRPALIVKAKHVLSYALYTRPDFEAAMRRQQQAMLQQQARVPGNGGIVVPGIRGVQ